MKVYTGEGDFGETYDLKGFKHNKDSPVIHFLGALDELNSHLGLIKAMLLKCNFIAVIQKNIMKLMSHVSDKNCEDYLISDNDVSILEKEIDKLSDNIPRLNELIIPGKNITEAQVQITRTAARRAERFYFAVNTKQSLRPQAGIYLNRLSDYLFILSQQDL